MKPTLFLLLTAVELAAANLTFEADRWARSKDAIVLNDMSRVEPKSALSDIRKTRHWKVLEYETATTKGKCIATLPDTGAPNVTLALNVKGWYAVYVGLGGVGRFAWNQENVARLKLTRDVTFQHRVYTGTNDDIEEVFFKAADLTGQNLEIAQYRFRALMDRRPLSNPRITVVMYVKLVPLTDDEVAWIKHDRERTDTKRLVATMDAFSWISQHYPTTREEFLEDFESLRDTDFGAIYWQIVGGGLVNYKSKLGTIPGEHVDDFPRTGDGYFTASVKKFIEMGTDHTKMAVEAAHSMGKKIHIGIRAQAWQCPPEFEDFFTSDFYRKHPEWRAYDRDGTQAMRMSYAVPEVQQFLYGIAKEVLQHRPDGIEWIYFRGLPNILWEDAFSRRFKTKYGADAKQVAENDPRLYDLRCEIMTEFMRGLRKTMDDVQRTQGRAERYKLTVSVVQTEEDNRMYGLDVERWVKQGLIDRIGVFPLAFHVSKKPVDMDWFMRITKGTKVEVYPLIIAWRLPTAAETLTQVQKYYQEGAQGLLVWDPDPTGKYTPFNAPANLRSRSYWPLVPRLGHIEDLARLQAEKRPEAKFTKLKRYGDYWFGRWIPDVGF